MLDSTEIRVLLQKILEGKNLGSYDITGLLDEAYTQSNDVLLAAVLIGLEAKGISIDDIFYTSEWLKNNMIEISDTPSTAIDICGTGGDKHKTFNISTAAAFIVAEAGVPVIKHGGRSNKGCAGSSDVLSALNIDLCKKPSDCAKALQNSNIAFLDAPSFHSALSRFRLVRAKLGVPTILNIAAAITNPAHVTRQVVGVYRKDLVQTVAGVLCKTNKTEHALVVHGCIDEITICGETTIAEVTQNSIKQYNVGPKMFGLKTAELKDIAGGNAEYNAKIIMDVLSGTQGPCSDIVALNAGACIYVGGKVKTLHDGVSMAREILASGNGLRKLKQAQKNNN